MGLKETATVMQLLKHPDLTLSKAVELATLEESAQKDQQQLAGKEPEVCAVRSVQRRPNNKFQKQPVQDPNKPCGRCGFATHTGPQCPANGRTCKKCGKRGHFAPACRSKKVNEMVLEEVSDYTNRVSTHDKYFLGEVQSAEKSAWVVNLNMEEKTVPFKIDTGADISVVTEETWSYLLKPKLTKTSACRMTPGGELKARGEFMSSTSWKGKPHTFKVVVAQGSLSNSLLARDMAVKIGLVARLDEVKSKKVGLMATEPVKIELRDDAQPYDGSSERGAGQDGGV